MKHNVDLTMNRDFNRRKPLNLSKLMFNMDYPWSESELERYKSDNRHVIFTGNKEERQRKQKWVPYENGVECECCGRNYSNTPWRMAMTLCQRCDEWLERDHIKKNDLVLSNLK